jgi:hypothetical protein
MRVKKSRKDECFINNDFITIHLVLFVELIRGLESALRVGRTLKASSGESGDEQGFPAPRIYVLFLG